MAGKKSEESGLDVNALFEQELQSRADDLYREAAIAMLSKLRPSNHITVAEFLDGLTPHPDVWSVVSTMGVGEFAAALLGRTVGDSTGSSKRS